MAEDIYPDAPKELFKVCVSQDVCSRAKSYSCKYSFPITDFGNLPAEDIKVNETRFIMPKITMDKIENEHEWSSLNPIRAKLDKGVIITQHNFDDENYGFLIVDKSTFLDEIVKDDNSLRNRIKTLPD